MRKFVNNNDFIGGCGFMNKDDNKEAQIKKVLIKC